MFFFRYDIQAIMHAVDEIYIPISGLAEHHLCPLRATPRCVRRFIFQPNIRLNLRNHRSNYLVPPFSHQKFTKKFLGDITCRSLKKLLSENFFQRYLYCTKLEHFLRKTPDGRAPRGKNKI